jgi:hypothetical protein
MNQELSAGKYFLGDPSFVLHDKLYTGIWGNLYNYQNGKFTLEGHDFCVHSTHKGDGTFYDTRNRKYLVDSGVIGLVHIDLIEDINLCKGKGYIFDFKVKISFIYDAGLFYVKCGKNIINIDTRDLESYESDLEEHCEGEDGEYISKTMNYESDSELIEPENLFDSDDENYDEETKEEVSEKFSFFKKK